MIFTHFYDFPWDISQGKENREQTREQKFPFDISHGKADTPCPTGACYTGTRGKKPGGASGPTRVAR